MIGSLALLAEVRTASALSTSCFIMSSVMTSASVASSSTPWLQRVRSRRMLRYPFLSSSTGTMMFFTVAP